LNDITILKQKKIKKNKNGATHPAPASLSPPLLRAVASNASGMVLPIYLISYGKLPLI